MRCIFALLILWFANCEPSFQKPLSLSFKSSLRLKLRVFQAYLLSRLIEIVGRVDNFPEPKRRAILIKEKLPTLVFAVKGLSSYDDHWFDYSCKWPTLNN